jgi:hypothetical protein
MPNPLRSGPSQDRPHGSRRPAAEVVASTQERAGEGRVDPGRRLGGERRTAIPDLAVDDADDKVGVSYLLFDASEDDWSAQASLQAARAADRERSASAHSPWVCPPLRLRA